MSETFQQSPFRVEGLARDLTGCPHILKRRARHQPIGSAHQVPQVPKLANEWLEWMEAHGQDGQDGEHRPQTRQRRAGRPSLNRD